MAKKTLKKAPKKKINCPDTDAYHALLRVRMILDDIDLDEVTEYERLQLRALLVTVRQVTAEFMMPTQSVKPSSKFPEGASQ